MRFFIVLVDGVEGVAFVEHVGAMSGNAACCAVVLMVGNRGRSKGYPVTEHPQPPAKIDILEKREIIRVEATHLQEKRPVYEHRAAAGEEQFARLDSLA